MHIDNESNRVPKGYMEITIPPSNEQLADAIGELESNCVVLNKLTSALTERIDRMKSQLFWLSYVSFFFWCCLVLYWVLG